MLWGATRDGRFDNFPLLLRDAREFAARTKSLERVEFFGYGGAGPLPIREPSGNGVFRARRALVSGGYFDLLGTKPVLGRALQPEDDVTGAAPVVVLSYSAWQRYFGGDPDVLGRRIVVHYTGSGAHHRRCNAARDGLSEGHGFLGAGDPELGPARAASRCTRSST